MITSTSNAQIKELAKLQKKSRLRDERRIFLVEGPRMVEEIPKERIERLYISESFERKILHISGSWECLQKFFQIQYFLMYRIRKIHREF